MKVKYIRICEVFDKSKPAQICFPLKGQTYLDDEAQEEASAPQRYV